jgi:hypothetical protein
MKLDPGMHIVMHLVFFGKTGVTSAWSIIKRDVIRAFDALSSMDCCSFHHLNDTLLILWATIALLASSTALGKNFPKR